MDYLSNLVGSSYFPLKTDTNCSNIAPYVTIYQKSYELGSVTDDWIMAVITALLKKGDKNPPVNYRPG
jgi:hypothetical protein